MKAIRSWTAPNPILVKELRSRMRGSRAFIILTAALVIMALMMIGLISLFTQASNTFGNMLSPQIGQILFEGLINFELLLVCTVTPAITAGAISIEREKLTFEMLLATPLGPAKILWGKLISALSYVFLLIFAAIPLASLVFLFGGVAPLTMLKALFILVVVAVTLGIYGLFLSALLGRTGRATVISFVSVMALLLGPLVGVVASGLMYGSRMVMPRLLLAFSPISMLVSAVESVTTINSGSVISLFGLIGGQWDTTLNPLALTQIPRPIYHYSLAICGVVSILLFTLTMALLNPARRFYLSRRTALTGGAVLATFAVVLGAAFLLTAPRYEWVLVNGNANPDNNAPARPVIAPPVVRALPAVAYPAPGPTPSATEIGGAYPFPGPTPAPTATTSTYPVVTQTVITVQGAGMSLKDQIEIYAAAARQVYWKDSSFSDPDHPFPLVYLVSVTNDRAGDPDGIVLASVPITADLQAGISAALADLPAKVSWSPFDAVPRDAAGRAVQAGGLAITFGNIRVHTDGKIHLPASSFISPQIGAGQTYVLEKVGGIWKVTGTTGKHWIS